MITLEEFTKQLEAEEEELLNEIHQQLEEDNTIYENKVKEEHLYWEQYNNAL